MAQLKDLLVNGSARVIGSLFANLSGNVLNFGICSTAAGTSAKTVTTGGTFELIEGSKVLVLFQNTDTSNAPTLNVNGTGAKNIKINASDGIGKGFLTAQQYYWFIYDGTNWRTAGAGITQIIPTQYGGTGNSSYTANRIIYSNTATKLASGTVTTDGAYLGAVSYLTVNEAHQTSYRFLVNGASYFKDNITIKGHVLPQADSTYNIGSTVMHWANGYFDYLYISTDTGFTSDTSGKAGVLINGNSNSAIELFGSTPYIDFHQNNSTADYTSRIIADAANRLHFQRNGTPANLTYNSRTINPMVYFDGNSIYTNSQIESADYFLNNRASAGGGYHVYGNNVEYGRWWINTIGVAGTATTYTNPNDSSQTKTGYTGNVTGQIYLSIGNNKTGGSNGSSYSSPGSQGAANNAQGYLRLYSSDTDYSDTTTYGSRLNPINGIALLSNKIGIMFRPESGSYYTHFAYETSGNEALVMATQNAVTSFIFVNGESYANVAADRWTKLTGASGAGPAPGIQIKNNCVSIGELWAHNVTPDYKLRVNGTSQLKGNTTVGTTTGGSLGIAQTDGAGRGISLYNGPTSAMPDYGIAFAKTATFGIHGAVTSDWATYFTMSDTTNRGWIFRRGSTNVASIDGTGKLYLGYAASTANPGIYWNPYVESASDGSDVSAIYQIKSGVAGGTELRISQANDATDVINIVSPQLIYLNSKKAFKINDTWLRINEDKGFSSGIYTGSSLVRTDNQLQVGDSGNKFYANSSGNGYFSNTLGIAGTNTSYKLYVNGTSYFNNNTTHNGNILPNTTNTYDLGSSSYRWKALFATTLNGNLAKKLTIQANGTQKGQFNNSADVTVNLGNVAQDFTGANSGNATNINADTFAGMTRQQWLNTVYPIGSIYMSVSATSPATLFGGTWESLGGRFLIGQDGTYTAGSTGGSATHTHTIAHTHTYAHTHTTPATTTGNHTLTTSEIPSHTHSIAAQTSSGPSNNNTSSAGSHRHKVSEDYDKANPETPSTGGYLIFHTVATSGKTGVAQESYPSLIWPGGVHTHTLNSHTHTIAAHSTQSLGGGGGHTHSQVATTTNSQSANTTSAASNANSGSASTLPPYLAVYMWKRTA